MGPKTVRWLCVASMLGAAACDSDRFSTGVEEFLTIRQGVYGQVTSYDDVGGRTDYLPGISVDAFVVPTPPPEPPLYQMPPGELGPPVASMVSTAHGFYELALDPGDYLLCALPCGPDLPRCTIATVPAGGLVRRDYSFDGSPNGWSP